MNLTEWLEYCERLHPVGIDLGLERVREVARGGTTIILITHHIEEIVPEIEHVVFVRQGAIVADGTKHDILTSERLSDVFQAPIALEAEGDGYYYARPKARSI